MSNRRRLRVPPSREQIEAANSEARGMMRAALPGSRVSRGQVPAWAAEMMNIDGDIAAAPRCRHLEASPAQPWMAYAWEHVWRCRRCTAEHARATAGKPLLSPVEEGTCDKCRRYVGAEQLDLLMLRQDLWMLTAAVCRDCQGWAQSNGAKVWSPTGASP
jgi:hypothetical protein